MGISSLSKGITRRRFLQGTIAGVCFSILHPFHTASGAESATNPLFWIRKIPEHPFYGDSSRNFHAGVDYLLHLMGKKGLKFYRSDAETILSGPSGMIASDDVVLIKVNAQWKYRGCTNSDLIRGLIQSILDHPDGFEGEVVIFENGQGRGSLNCDTTGSNYLDGTIHANALNENHSFLYLVNEVFDDPRVSAILLDPFRDTFISKADHTTDGYRIYENVSYPCFTTQGGHRVELQEGIWTGNGFNQNLKLISVPVLKVHGGSEITASLKHFYGVVSMEDGRQPFRHYDGLGKTCGKMVVSVRTPVLNILDAIWVSHLSLSGYPANATIRANQILASQDPVALDYWAAKHIFYPITKDPRHLPSSPAINRWLKSARNTINDRGGLYDPDGGISVRKVTKNEEKMAVHLLKFSETVSGLNDPSGVNEGTVGIPYDYSVDGAYSNLGDPVQYFFDWGDGTDSGWLSAGQTSAPKSWISPGTYEIEVQARCANHTYVKSNWSNPLRVTISTT